MYVRQLQVISLAKNSDEERELKRFNDIPDGVMSVTQDIRTVSID